MLPSSGGFERNHLVSDAFELVEELHHCLFNPVRFHPVSIGSQRDILGSLTRRHTVFERALSSWNKEPSQVLFIEDSEGNVTGGPDSALHTHHFTGAETLEHELRSRRLI